MFAFAALFLLVPTAHAWPFCLNQEDANMLATNFGLLISSYSNSLANLTLAPDYTDYSESVNTLIDGAGTAPQSLLGATFSSRAQFETASAAQPSVPFQVENVWFTCDVITIRWLSNQSPQPVVGITVAHAVFNPNFRGHRTMWQIDQVWAEFDSAAWLVNLGFTITPPASSRKREVGFTA